jgi:DNA-binding response OmpR family regulator
MSEQQGKERGARILVIDDEEILHISLRRSLGRQGHHVDTVLSGPEGLQMLESNDYDLVITDLMMPDMDGIELLECMEEQNITVPVLMITGYPSIRTAVKALRLGAVDYLAKPFTRQELLGPVNRTLRGGGAASLVPPGKAPAGDVDGYDVPTQQLVPGSHYYLRKHSWAEYQEDGTFKVGIEASFLESIGVIASIELPEETDLVEQGFTGFRLKTVNAEEHAVFMPLSGQVIAVNREAGADPASVGSETWLAQVIPDHLDSELSMLLKR